jgi:AcrR family transcriptional regulator
VPRTSRVGTRQEILATALDLFLAQGYEATSLREIAERLEITKAALYYHFPAKEQIAVELSREFFNSMGDLVAKARAARHEPDTEKRRIALLSDYLEILLSNQKVVNLLSRNPATQNHPDIGLRGRNLLEAFTAEVAGPDARSEDKLRVACAIGVIHAVVMAPLVDVDKAKRIILGAALATLESSPLQAPFSASPRADSSAI